MGLSLQKVYDKSPVLVQHVMASVSGYRQNRSRYGSVYWEHRRWLEDFDTWTLERKLEHQRDELLRFIRCAARESAFYRDLYSDVDLDSIRTVDDLRRLPVVDKEMLRAEMESVYTVPRQGNVEGHTGGTTGKSLVVLMTPSDMMKRMAMLDHFKHRVGFEHRKMRRATFSGKHIVPPDSPDGAFWRYNAACKQMLYSTFNLSNSNVERYIESLNRFRPAALDGFPSSIAEIATHSERAGIPIRFAPIAVFTTAETLTEERRKVIERVFNCPVYDQYASSEGAPFVTECSCGRRHIELSTGVFETYEDSNEVLVTSFSTYGTPLIRYRIGDQMQLQAPVQCRCGISSSWVSMIDGRANDYLFRADGTRISHIGNLFKHAPSAIIEAQCIQRSVDLISINLVVDKRKYSPKDEETVREEFARIFGSETRLDLNQVSNLPREASGKVRLIKNHIEDTA